MVLPASERNQKAVGTCDLFLNSLAIHWSINLEQYANWPTSATLAQIGSLRICWVTELLTNSISEPSIDFLLFWTELFLHFKHTYDKMKQPGRNRFVG